MVPLLKPNIRKKDALIIMGSRRNLAIVAERASLVKQESACPDSTRRLEVLFLPRRSKGNPRSSRAVMLRHAARSSRSCRARIGQPDTIPQRVARAWRAPEMPMEGTFGSPHCLPTACS